MCDHIRKLCLVFLFKLLSILALGRAVSLPRCKVLVIGTGPAGLLTSHCLLSRPNREYDINIFEAREDPRIISTGPRAYSLGLNIRGQTAVKYFDVEKRSNGLWKEIFAAGVETDSFYLHVGKLKIPIRKPANKSDRSASPPPTVLLARNRLSEAMLNGLERVYGISGNLKVEFNSRLQSVDLNKRLAIIDGKEYNYDLIIGADGVQSPVRQAMIHQAEATEGNNFVAEEVILPGKFKVMQQPMPTALENNAIHAMEVGKSAGFGLFLIPAPSNTTCVLLNWRGEEGTGRIRSNKYWIANTESSLHVAIL